LIYNVWIEQDSIHHEVNLRDIRIFIALKVFTATCFSNVAVMGSLDVRLSVCPSVRNVGDS